METWCADYFDFENFEDKCYFSDFEKNTYNNNDFDTFLKNNYIDKGVNVQFIECLLFIMVEIHNFKYKKRLKKISQYQMKKLKKFWDGDTKHLQIHINKTHIRIHLCYNFDEGGLCECKNIYICRKEKPFISGV